MSDTTSGNTSAVTNFGAGDADIPAAIGGGGTAGPSVGAGNATGPIVSANPTGIELPGLPAQYSTAGGLGFFSRQMEVAPTSVTVGPDGALYVGELSGLPYPEGYARVLRIANPEETTGFDGQVRSGVVETYASGFSQINGLSFDGAGNLYVLEFVNGSNLYNPLLSPAELPPGQLIRVAPDGTRTTISGPELKIGNYVFADKETGDVYVSNGNADINNGQVLRYRVDPETGKQASVEVVAEGLNNPRGMAFGPDGRLYVNEQGRGTPGDSPDAATAPTVPFIPGLVNERGGFTASITRLDTDGTGDGGRVFTGIPSIIEVDAITGQDRVISVGSNGFTIAPDGTAYVAAGGGLSIDTANALGPFGEFVKGILRVEGLFDGDPSDATITPTFNSVDYASRFGPDGSTTLFNTQSNLNDVAIGTDGKLYTVDAARNVMYGFEENGDQATPDSVTAMQKRPPVLSPPQYTSIVAAGGDPTADYNVEVTERTFKNASGAPDTPGRAQAAANTAGASSAGASGPPGAAPTGAPPTTSGDAGSRGEDAAAGTANAAAASGLPGDIPLLDPAFPGPIDPTSPPRLPGNVSTPYFDPFFGGNYAPSGGSKALPAGENGGTYTVSRLFSFGDRLSDDGGQYGAASVAAAAGQPAPNSASIYYKGGFSDGPMWTENLERILGVATEEDRNFAYVNATARELFNPVDPLYSNAGLSDFDGQIDAFARAYGSLSANDLVTVNFGGNDLTLPSNVTPQEGIALSVQALVDGLERLADLGARHFLVTNVANVELAPLFKDPGFLQQLGAAPGAFTPLVDEFNAQLATALDAFEDEEGVDVELLDVNELFDAIAADPHAYGFLNMDQSVLALPPIQPGTPEVYNPAIVGQDPAVRHATLFVDPVFHPTALGHAILGETARDYLLA
jgi:phospholipase/lecithinase/hemolysin